eukprot:19625-Hanusia_phi.AAC.1
MSTGVFQQQLLLHALPVLELTSRQGKAPGSAAGSPADTRQGRWMRPVTPSSASCAKAPPLRDG